MPSWGPVSPAGRGGAGSPHRRFIIGGLRTWVSGPRSNSALPAELPFPQPIRSKCATTIIVAGRIAAPENVPEPSSVASPCLLPLPHRSPPESELLFPLFDISCLLLWVLWGCGRRARVVQAQRQIHRALGKAGVIKPSTPRAGRSVIHSGAGRVRGTFVAHCKSLRNDIQAAVPAQAGIIRLRHRALLRRSQSQAPPLGSRRPVAAQLLAAIL